MSSRPTSEDVERFLHRFEDLAAEEDFDLLEELFDEHAVVRFSDGDFVGRRAIRAAFERTWRRDPTVRDARLRLSDIVVLTLDERSASATYIYTWEGMVGDRPFSITGRGTRVLVHDGEGFRIKHEHLSRSPTPPAG